MVNSVPILLVDDEQDHVLLVQDALGSETVRSSVHVVQTGEEAIAYLAGEGKFSDRTAHPLPFVLLLDLRMPGIGGFGVLRWLGGHPEVRSRLNVIVISSTQSANEIEVVHELGAQMFWSKEDCEGLRTKISYLKKSWLNPDNAASDGDVPEAETNRQGDDQ